MIKFIIEGEDLSKVMQENRIRIERGTIKFTRLDDADDSKEVAAADSKAVAGNDEKTPKQKK